MRRATVPRNMFWRTVSHQSLARNFRRMLTLDFIALSSGVGILVEKGLVH